MQHSKGSRNNRNRRPKSDSKFPARVNIDLASPLERSMLNLLVSICPDLDSQAGFLKWAIKEKMRQFDGPTRTALAKVAAARLETND